MSLLVSTSSTNRAMCIRQKENYDMITKRRIVSDTYSIIQDIHTCHLPQQTIRHQHIVYMMEVEPLRHIQL